MAPGCCKHLRGFFFLFILCGGNCLPPDWIRAKEKIDTGILRLGDYTQQVKGGFQRGTGFDSSLPTTHTTRKPATGTCGAFGPGYGGAAFALMPC